MLPVMKLRFARQVLWSSAMFWRVTEADLGNTSLRDGPQCQGPYQHHERIHVYHIMADTAQSGITEKNSADALGDMAFIFGGKGFPTPRGVLQYYDHGIVQMNHLSVSSWGDFLQCNHPAGSNVYTCKCPKDHQGPCDMERPGKVRNSHSDYNWWYSFPKAGEGKYWDYEHGSGCTSIEIHASCAIDLLAKEAGCPGKCSAKTASECVTCVNKLSDNRKHDVFDSAIFDAKCPGLRRRRSTPSPPPPPPPPPTPRRRRSAPAPTPRRRRTPTSTWDSIYDADIYRGCMGPEFLGSLGTFKTDHECHMAGKEKDRVGGVQVDYISWHGDPAKGHSGKCDLCNLRPSCGNNPSNWGRNCGWDFVPGWTAYFRTSAMRDAGAIARANQMRNSSIIV